jgi:hypothetical protein
MITKNPRILIFKIFDKTWLGFISGESKKALFVKHIQDKVYFGAIYKQMENGGYAAMLHDLLNMDLSDFDIRDVPDTQR